MVNGTGRRRLRVLGRANRSREDVESIVLITFYHDDNRTRRATR